MDTNTITSEMVTEDVCALRELIQIEMWAGLLAIAWNITIDKCCVNIQRVIIYFLSKHGTILVSLARNKPTVTKN